MNTEKINLEMKCIKIKGILDFKIFISFGAKYTWGMLLSLGPRNPKSAATARYSSFDRYCNTIWTNPPAEARREIKIS